MRAAFLALIGASAEIRAVIERELATSSLRPVAAPAGCALHAGPALAGSAIVADGVTVLGALFAGLGCHAQRRTLEGRAAGRVIDTKGDDLITSHWGGYVAFIAGAGGAVHVLRDPSGACPAYHLRAQGVDLVFSDVAVPLALGLLKPAIDWGFAAQSLAYPFLRTARTGLEGVREILPGLRMTFEQGTSSEHVVWSPWRLASPENACTDRAEAARRLREVVIGSVGAWTCQAGAAVLELSGGLDSSIVAAGLAHCGASFSCINLATAGADGDERHYARQMARHIGVPLVEIAHDDDAVDLMRRPRTLRPRPGGFGMLQAADASLGLAAQAQGAETIFSGTGGDNVFCYLTTAAPVVDAFRRHRAGRVAARALGDVARLCGCTVWTALRHAIRKARADVCPQSWPRDGEFLAAEALPAGPEPHPWLDAPPGTLPGRWAHVASLLRIQMFLDGYDRATDHRMIYPLLSQPVVEHCLRVPSWLWVAGGRDRAVARDAFADLLPPEIVHRRTKGRLESMSASIYMRSRPAIGDRLLGGLLREQGLIDGGAIRAYLSEPGPPRDTRYFRLLSIVDLELWARRWAALASSPPPPLGH